MLPIGALMSNPPKPPVYFAVAQALFHPIPAMDRYSTDIQDAFRRKGYPQYEIIFNTQVQLHAGKEPQLAQAPSWFFTNRDSTAGFILSYSSLTYRTTSYCDSFIGQLTLGLNILDEILSLEHINRLGVRHLNAVIPKVAGDNLQDYLLDPLPRDDVDEVLRLRQSLNESTYDTSTSPLLSKSTLIKRIYQMTSPLGYPVDMQPIGLIHSPNYNFDEVRSHAIIDLDHFAEGDIVISTGSVDQQLINLNQTLERVLFASLRSEAN